MTYQQVLDRKVNADNLSTRIIVEEWKGEVSEYIEKYEYYRLSLPDITEKWAQHYPLPKIISLASISSFAYYIVKAKLPQHFHYVKEKNWEDIDDIAIAEMVVFRKEIVRVLEKNGIDPSIDDVRLKCDECTEERKRHRGCQPPTTMNIGFGCFAGEPEGKVFFDDFGVVRLGSEGKKHIIQIYYNSENPDNALTPVRNVDNLFNDLLSSRKFPVFHSKFREIYRNNYAVQLNNLIQRLQQKFQSLELVEREVKTDITPFLLTQPLTEEERETYRPHAEQWLNDPTLLVLIKKTLDQTIVRETKNKLTTFLSAHTAIFSPFQSGKHVVHIISTGPSSLGKNYIETNVLRLFPLVFDLTGITPKAFDWAQLDFNKCILYIRELKGAETANVSLRVLMTEGGLKLLVPQRDSETGKIQTTVIVTKGTPDVHSTTIGYIQEELFTRVIDYMPDPSSEQTGQILLHQAEDVSTIYKPTFSVEEMILRCILETLEPIRVIVPYATKLAEIFPRENKRARRDYLKLISFIMAIASLYRKQRFQMRLTVQGQEETVVVANLDDLYYAVHIVWENLAKTMLDVPKPALNFYEQLKTKIPLGQGFTVKDASKATRLAYSTCGSYLWQLVKKGYLTSEKIEGRRAYTYTLLDINIGTQQLLGQITEDFFTIDDFKDFLLRNSVNPSIAELSRYFQTWQGKGRFNLAELSDEINIEFQ